jgi:hypothetical protein
MQTFESTLGTVTLLLAGIALALAIAILVLYEAGWIISVGVRLYRRCSTSIRQFLHQPNQEPGVRQHHGGQDTNPSGSSGTRGDPLSRAHEMGDQACLCIRHTDDETGGD